MKVNSLYLIVQCALITLFCLVNIDVAWADALPWEKPLETLQTSLTGPVAKAIGVIALAAAGGMLAFGGELGDFTKRILMVVMALAVLLLANNFISMFGV